MIFNLTLSPFNPEGFLSLLLLPLIVSPAKFTVPALRCLKISQLAQLLCLSPNIFLCQQNFVIDFCVESELHLTIGWSSTSFFTFTTIFLPSE
jgi:hypothetical protein